MKNIISPLVAIARKDTASDIDAIFLNTFNFLNYLTTNATELNGLIARACSAVAI